MTRKLEEARARRQAILAERGSAGPLPPKKPWETDEYRALSEAPPSETDIAAASAPVDLPLPEVEVAPADEAPADLAASLPDGEDAPPEGGRDAGIAASGFLSAEATSPLGPPVPGVPPTPVEDATALHAHSEPEDRASPGTVAPPSDAEASLSDGDAPAGTAPVGLAAVEAAALAQPPEPTGIGPERLVETAPRAPSEPEDTASQPAGEEARPAERAVPVPAEAAASVSDVPTSEGPPAPVFAAGLAVLREASARAGARVSGRASAVRRGLGGFAAGAAAGSFALGRAAGGIASRAGARLRAGRTALMSGASGFAGRLTGRLAALGAPARRAAARERAARLAAPAVVVLGILGMFAVAIERRFDFWPAPPGPPLTVTAAAVLPVPDLPAGEVAVPRPAGRTTPVTAPVAGSLTPPGPPRPPGFRPQAGPPRPDLPGVAPPELFAADLRAVSVQAVVALPSVPPRPAPGQDARLVPRLAEVAFAPEPGAVQTGGWTGPIPRVLVFLPDRQAEGLEEVLAKLGALGLEPEAMGEVGFTVRETHLRFYHGDDREGAARLAEAVGGDARDFTGARPLPPPGTLEVWVAGTARARPPAEPPRPMLLHEYVARFLGIGRADR